MSSFLTSHQKNIFVIIAIVLLSTVLVYLPFITHAQAWLGLEIRNPGMYGVYQNYDGPLYVVVAKTWYDPTKITVGPSANYFAAHLPLYPFFIWLFTGVMGFLRSMLFVNILFSVVLSIAFYAMLVRLKLTEQPLLLTSVMLFLPRFLAVRTVGAPETLFMAMIMLSVFCFEKGKYWWAGLFGGLATMTKVPGILLFIGYGLVFAETIYNHKKMNWNWLGIFLIPLGLLAVFEIYQMQYHDFFAYFHTDAVVPMPYPFSAFNWQAKWVNDAWVEDIVLYFFLYLLTAITLFKSQHRSFFYFTAVFFAAATFVQHKDLSRYLLPLWPFACIAFEKYFTSKKFLIALIILLPAIYLFTWNFMTYNIMPITDWGPFK